MTIQTITTDVAKKFQYKKDSIKIFDSWRILDIDQDTISGDCEDFSLTVIWNACGRNFLKFVLFVLILHKYRIHRVVDKNGESHAVGEVDQLWFDNWTMKALPKDQFFLETKHTYKHIYPSPLIILYMLIGLVIK